VRRAHDAGAKVIHQVHTATQAQQAAERGVDVLIAQDGEAGGFGQFVATMALVPQVVDAVRPLLVLAAGGIADGRGIAAALLLGADGVNLGTRFLASVEAPIPDAWKDAIVAARSEDAVKVSFWNEVMPQPGRGGYGTVPRALRTPFWARWAPRPSEAAQRADEIRAELGAALSQGSLRRIRAVHRRDGRLIHEVLPVAQIVRRLVAETTETLARASTLLGPATQ
jgi:nitronate monooxygenase/enoyl-[acyl-carrier protein] reductase II